MVAARLWFIGPLSPIPPVFTPLSQLAPLPSSCLHTTTNYPLPSSQRRAPCSVLLHPPRQRPPRLQPSLQTTSENSEPSLSLLTASRHLSRYRSSSNLSFQQSIYSRTTPKESRGIHLQPSSTAQSITQSSHRSSAPSLTPFLPNSLLPLLLPAATLLHQANNLH